MRRRRSSGKSRTSRRSAPSSPRFADACSNDDAESEEILSWPLWRLLDDDAARDLAWLHQRADERPGGKVFPAVNGSDCVPEEEAGALHCMRVAKGDPKLFKKLYAKKPTSYVLRLYAHQIASEYHRRLTDEDLPEDKFYEDYVDDGSDNRDPYKGFS
jgi:hypothetical protein